MDPRVKPGDDGGGCGDQTDVQMALGDCSLNSAPVAEMFPLPPGRTRFASMAKRSKALDVFAFGKTSAAEMFPEDRR